MKDNDEEWFGVAYAFSRFSLDPHRKVGAVLVRDGKLLSYDWNRELAAWPIRDWNDRAHVNERIQHAEIGALQADSRGCTLYVTKQPCENCEKVIKNRGVTVKWKEMR
jgi:dCMP deaminase